MPRFAFGFVGVVLFNSLRLLPTGVVAATTAIALDLVTYFVWTA